MKLHSPLPHRKARIEIIPLIDIMFFLLASFMLVSMSMIRLAGVKVSLPQAATADPLTKPDFETITLKADGTIYWSENNQPKPIVKEQITELIKPLFQVNKDLKISINADSDATHGTVIEILDRIKQAGVTKVSFATKRGALQTPGAVPPTPGSAPAATPPAPPAPPLPPAPQAPATPVPASPPNP